MQASTDGISWSNGSTAGGAQQVLTTVAVAGLLQMSPTRSLPLLARLHLDLFFRPVPLSRGPSDQARRIASGQPTPTAAAAVPSPQRHASRPTLVLVESPAKAKKIQQFLGADFQVRLLHTPLPTPPHHAHSIVVHITCPALPTGLGSAVASVSALCFSAECRRTDAD